MTKTEILIIIHEKSPKKISLEKILEKQLQNESFFAQFNQCFRIFLKKKKRFPQLYSLRYFWCVVIQEVKDGENESPCNCASTGFYVRALPTKWHRAINRTSASSLGQKIPETQKFNDLKILKKIIQNSICKRTTTSYGHNIAKKNRGSSMMFQEIYSFFPFLEKMSIWTSMSLI